MKDIIRVIASLPRRQKQAVLVVMDICVLPLMMWLVYAIRLAKPNVPVMEGLDFWYLYVGVFGVAIFAYSAFIARLYAPSMKTICYGSRLRHLFKLLGYMRLRNLV